MDETHVSENGNGKYTTPGSKWELYAKEMVLWKYPGHELKFQTPTIRIDNTINGTMRPDISVYKDRKMIAVVEVGDLSRPDKLTLLKAALPEVSVWWIPKTDLLSIVMPSLDEFRLAKYAREEIGAGLLSELLRERQEIVELRKAMGEGIKFMRRFGTAIKNISHNLDDALSMVKEWERTFSPVEFKETGMPDHDTLLNDLTEKNELTQS